MGRTWVFTARRCFAATLAGNPGVAGSADGSGNAARFNNPTGVAVDIAGQIERIEHGRGGEVRIQALQEGPRRGLRLTFTDQGPGIPDLAKALQDGFTTGNGMGLGLSGSKRLMNDFDIQTEVGKGTTVMIARWK